MPKRPRLASVNVARPVHVADMDYARRTAIDKRPVAGPVAARTLGLDGDAVGDRRYHGGVDQAVYAFAREDLDLWAGRLGVPLPSGVFGENLTTSGVDVNAAVLGERWRVGTALLEVSSVRIPCSVFSRWLGVVGADVTGWTKRFTLEARPGPYLRVVEEGVVEAGDEVVVETRPEHGVTVSLAFRALTTERPLLARLLDVPALPDALRAKAEAYVASTGRAAVLDPA